MVSKVFLKLQLQEGSIFTYVITYFKNFCSQHFMRQEPSWANKILHGWYIVGIKSLIQYITSRFFLMVYVTKFRVVVNDLYDQT